MTSQPAFPEDFDSTMVSALRSCPRKFYLSYVLRYLPPKPSPHDHAAASFNAAVIALRTAFFVQGQTEDEALNAALQALVEHYGDYECPIESASSLARLSGALEYYALTYPFKNDGVAIAQSEACCAIPFSFSAPVGLNHPDTGKPIAYVGQINQVVERDGALFGLIEKTTGAHANAWGKQLDLDSIITGACWSGQHSGAPLRGFIVRSISISKVKYEIREFITYRPPWLVKTWHEQVVRDILRMQTSWHTGEWDYSFGEACNAYGGCVFRKVCLSQDPMQLLETEYCKTV